MDQVVGQRRGCSTTRSTTSTIRIPASTRSFYVEGAGLGGDAKFVKTTVRARYYHTLSEELDMVGLLTGGAGHIDGFGCDGLRTFDLFKSSDRIIRGFEYNGIGPYDAVTGEQLGGESYIHASAEAQFPLPARSGELRPAWRRLCRRGDVVRQRWRRIFRV